MDLSQDYFAVFELPMGLELDGAQLSRQYLALVKTWHPDRFVNEDETQKLKAVQAAALVNSAYQTLKDPLKRAQYLLRCHGIDANDETDTHMAMDFLMQQMAWREQLEELTLTPQQNSLKINELLTEVKENYQTITQAAHAAAQAQDWQQLREWVRKWQFVSQFLQQVEHLAAG